MFVSSGAAADSSANLVCKQMGLQGRVVWFDAEANIWALSTRAGVADTIAKCKAANINTIVLDVKPLAGFVLFNSRIAPKLIEFEGKPYPAKYDLLQVTIDEAHKAGIAVHAAMNVFSEGSQILPGGPSFKHPEWQSVQYEVERFLTASDGTTMKLTCSNQPYIAGDICLYGLGSKVAGNLPSNTTWVRIDDEGNTVQYGNATGRARISTPDKGFLLLGTGEAGEWLKQKAQAKVKLGIDGKGILRRVGDLDNVHNALFVNPVNPQVRKYELSIVKEICQKYAVDGIVLDRMRYPNIYSDFSDISRRAFEEHIGRKVQNWPDDVFKRKAVPGDDIVRGPLFKEWLKFRAKVIRDFLAEARDVVKSTKPKAKMGIYVGSWYPMYYDVGVNWGSPNNCAQYEWWPDGYEETGYAGLLDYICTGCYYTYPTRADAKAANEEDWKSVEAATEESIKAVQDATFVYGSLYVYQYKNRPDRFVEAMKQCLEKTQGCMIFDLVYLREYDWWPLLNQVFASPAKAPHNVPGLIDKVNGRRR